jgi:hypothetical protein
MRHRHLTHQEFTLAAIDDIISNGQRAAWERLCLALLREAGIRDKILRVCNARVNETSAQRHQFWRYYAQEIPHRASLDADHVFADLTQRFDTVLAQLESVAGWQTARVQRPVQILGSLGGILTGSIPNRTRSRPCSS